MIFIRAGAAIDKKRVPSNDETLFSETDNGFHNSRQVAKCPTNLVHGIAGADISASSRFKVQGYD